MLGCHEAWLFVALEYCGHATPLVEICLCETNPFVKVIFLFFFPSFFCTTIYTAFFHMGFKMIKLQNEVNFYVPDSVLYENTLFFNKVLFCFVK